MLTFSELTPSLTVTEFKINVEGLDYTMLGHKLEPTKDVIAINSNFIHKAFEGYEQYLSKPKADSVHIIRYFPRSGGIQVFGSFDPVTIFLRYLSECSLPEFSSVELVGGNKTLLCNYKFVINIESNKFIHLSTLAYALESVDGIHEILPFPIKYIKNDAGDIHSKIVIVFTSKIRKLFSNPNDFGDFICDVPIPDCER
ncbi:hypothetical protein RIR_jg31690.t1 [Rhizophagus irregularis DAOM 181602=DAOM 197198]|nr:hypothetical protein RIR_jg31690.t1 [Rhizophagus irregularis DAOM 181602=DAOM 197198]